MAFTVTNQTRQQKTLNLIGGNSVTLMPFGSSDVTGRTDCAKLLEGEEKADDVVNALKAGDITLEKHASALAAQNETQSPGSGPEKPSKRVATK